MTKAELHKLKKAELIEMLACQELEIDDLRRDAEQSEEDLAQAADELNDAQNELSSLETTANSEENIAEKAFNAGFESCILGSEQLKGWLNYRIEVEL